MLRKQGDIVREAVKKCELPQYEVKKVLHAVQDAIWDFMVNGDNVWFGKVGRFVVRTMPSREVRNPLTGEVFQQPIQRKATVHLFPPLKAAVKKNRRGLDNE